MIKFKDIKEDNIAIEFDNSKELNKLVEYLKIYEYNYGTTDDDLSEISDCLGISYFGNGGNFLSLDRSKKYYPRNCVSCGKGYEDVCYKFNEINWNVTD